MIENYEDFEIAKKFIPIKHWKNLMFMGVKNDNVYIYKHINTRRYIYIDTNGIFYSYNKGGLNKTTFDSAIEHLLS